MHIKIYFNEIPVYLCDTIDANLSQLIHKAGVILVNDSTPGAVKMVLDTVAKQKISAAVLLGTNFYSLKELFFSHFSGIEAAGGIVENKHKEWLFIYRLGKWDLPKGKIEKGELPDESALREVTEETGVTGLTIQRKIGDSYHTYHAFGKHYLKITHWYHIICSNDSQPVPQTEEDITAVQWIHSDRINEQLANTYPSIKDIIAAFNTQETPPHKF